MSADVKVFLLCSIPFVLIAFAWMAARKSSYHRGKADALQQVADDFRGLYHCTWWHKSKKKEQAAERKRIMLRLCLCDPLVCEALEAALVDAREHWGYIPRSPGAGVPEKPSERVGTHWMRETSEPKDEDRPAPPPPAPRMAS